MWGTAVLAGLHLFGNALILWLGYYWLGVGESTNGRLLWSFCVFLCFALSGLWLHGTALVQFGRPEKRSVLDSARLVLRHLIPLCVIVLVVVLVYDLLGQWKNAIGHQGFLIASFLTLHLRRPIKPRTMESVLVAILWLLRWGAVPAAFFPWASQVAAEGWRGLRPQWHVRRRAWLYWAEACALVICAIWVPLHLLAWIPKFHSFSLQMVSFCLRLATGYLLFVVALLVLEFLTSAGRPRGSQLSTVVSP